MKSKVTALLISAVLPIACNEAANLEQMGSNFAISAEEQAAIELYLDDLSDSATVEASSTTEVDASVQDDVKAERVEKMSARFMAELDVNASGDLSLDEFLIKAKKRAEELQASSEIQAKIIAKMTLDFTSHAGEDAALSIQEMATLLIDAAPRVGCHRQKTFPGKNPERVKATTQIIAKFDIDGNGILNVEEWETLKAERKEECKRWQEKKTAEETSGPSKSEGSVEAGADASIKVGIDAESLLKTGVLVDVAVKSEAKAKVD